jgi:general secretion pathway protein G
MPLVRPSRSRSTFVLRTPDGRGFTLIELLAAMAVMAVLVGLSLGMLRSSSQRAALARTRGELATLTQALESYKAHYGEYPQTGNAAQATAAVGADITTAQAQALLFNALIGVFGPTDFATLRNGPMFVEVGKLRLEQTRDLMTRQANNSFAVPTGSPPAKQRVATAFIDGWGNRYLYYYRQAPAAGSPGVNTWQRGGGYLLYSAGPDGQHLAPNITTGLFTGTTQTTGVNADNVFASP